MIYLPGPADGFESTRVVNDDERAIFSRFDGSARAATWRPVAVERFRHGKNWRPADFPFCVGVVPLVMRQSAVDALREILEANGEILPLSTDDGVALFAFNVTRVIDALDEDNSTLIRFSEDEPPWIDAAAFHEDLVRDVDIFRLPMRSSETYVGQRFVDRAQEAKLTGLYFALAWSPERGAIRRRVR